MTITTRTLAFAFKDAAGNNADGTVAFCPTTPFTNSGSNLTVARETQTVTLAAGAGSVTLYATDDADTSPTGATYTVTETITGADPRSYRIQVPAGSGTLQLADIAPAVSQPMYSYATTAALSALELDDLADVDAAAPTDGYFLKWVAADSEWQAAAGSGGGTVDVVSNVATSTILGRTTAGSGDSEELSPASARTLLGVAPIDLQVFTTPGGTWTAPTGGQTVAMVVCVGGGGGGGAGRRVAASNNSGGGGGGGGGALSAQTIPFSAISSPVTVTVGAGGAGAAGQVSDSTAGANGTSGADTTFGSYVRAGGGVRGLGGDGGGGGELGAAGTGTSSGTAGTGGTGNATTPSTASNAQGGGAAGGGGGCGVSSDSTGGTGGAGGVNLSVAATGAAGGSAGGVGTSGSSATGYDGGCGGGGGGSNTSGASAGAGGNGGNYGGGGGGGAGSWNGTTSGAGGNGANGICVVISW